MQNLNVDFLPFASTMLVIPQKIAATGASQKKLSVSAPGKLLCFRQKMHQAAQSRLNRTGSPTQQQESAQFPRETLGKDFPSLKKDPKHTETGTV